MATTAMIVPPKMSLPPGPKCSLSCPTKPRFSGAEVEGMILGTSTILHGQTHHASRVEVLGAAHRQQPISCWARNTLAPKIPTATTVKCCMANSKMRGICRSISAMSCEKRFKMRPKGVVSWCFGIQKCFHRWQMWTN